MGTRSQCTTQILIIEPHLQNPHKILSNPGPAWPVSEARQSKPADADGRLFISCEAWKIVRAGSHINLWDFVVLEDCITHFLLWVQLLLIVKAYLWEVFSTFIKMLSQTCNLAFPANLRGLNGYNYPIWQIEKMRLMDIK